MSAYRVGIRTDSDDRNAVLFLASGRLVAIVVELADEGHGEERGNWAVEAIFGLQHNRIPPSFPTFDEAAVWISACIGIDHFIPMGDLIELPWTEGSFNLGSSTAG